MITTTLQQIRECSPCREGWRSLLRGLNKKHADTDELTLGRIADVSGILNALWAIQAVHAQDHAKRELAFLAYSMVKRSCSAPMQDLVSAAMVEWGNNPHQDLSEYYNTATSTVGTTRADWVAAVSLHPDAAWAARWCAVTSLDMCSNSEKTTMARTLLIRQML